jgi:hypothetical protein
MFFRRLQQRMLSDPELIARCIRKYKLKLKSGKFLEWF